MLTLVIDGDNVFRALGFVRGADLSRAEGFLQDLERAAVERDWEVTVVFDGQERFMRRESGPLIVRYARGKTADTLIERTVYEQPDRSSVVVVTHDRAEANLVLGLGARVWDARRLIEEVKRGGDR